MVCSLSRKDKFLGHLGSPLVVFWDYFDALWSRFCWQRFPAGRTQLKLAFLLVPQSPHANTFKTLSTKFLAMSWPFYSALIDNLVSFNCCWWISVFITTHNASPPLCEVLPDYYIWSAFLIPSIFIPPDALLTLFLGIWATSLRSPFPQQHFGLLIHILDSSKHNMNYS